MTIVNRSVFLSCIFQIAWLVFGLDLVSHLSWYLNRQIVQANHDDLELFRCWFKKTFQKRTGAGIECTRCAYKSSFKLRLIFPLSKWNDNPLLCILFCRLHQQQQQQHQPIFVGGHGDEEMGGMSKACCGVTVTQAVSIRWFIVMIAFVGICCSVVGTVLGAMKASGREHLTVSLLMIGKDRMLPIYVCTIHLEFWTFLLLRTL